MNILIASSSFIIKESISNIFKRIYENIKLNTVNSIDGLIEDDDLDSDMLLLHITNKDYNIISTALKLKEKYKNIVILDQLKDTNILKLCIENNIDGYLTDVEDEYEFKYIIDKIMDGNKFYDSNVTHKLMNRRVTTDSVLTQREEAVIFEVSKGLSNRDVANTMGITEFTVKKHLSNALSKLGLKNRKDIIIYFNDK